MPSPRARARDVDAVLADAGVGRAGRVRRHPREADDRPVRLRDQARQAPADPVARLVRVALRGSRTSRRGRRSPRCRSPRARGGVRGHGGPDARRGPASARSAFSTDVWPIRRARERATGGIARATSDRGEPERGGRPAERPVRRTVQDTGPQPDPGDDQRGDAREARDEEERDGAPRDERGGHPAPAQDPRAEREASRAADGHDRVRGELRGADLVAGPPRHPRAEDGAEHERRRTGTTGPRGRRRGRATPSARRRRRRGPSRDRGAATRARRRRRARLRARAGGGARAARRTRREAGPPWPRSCRSARSGRAPPCVPSYRASMVSLPRRVDLRTAYAACLTAETSRLSLTLSETSMLPLPSAWLKVMP